MERKRESEEREREYSTYLDIEYSEYFEIARLGETRCFRETRTVCVDFVHPICNTKHKLMKIKVCAYVSLYKYSYPQHKLVEIKAPACTYVSLVRRDLLLLSAHTQSRPAEGMMGRLLPNSRDLSTLPILLLVSLLRMTLCANCLGTARISDI